MPAAIVLDTNAWLDLLVFEDPRIAAVEAAHAAGRVEYLLDEAGRTELARVLAYPALRLDPDAAVGLLERACTLARDPGAPAALSDVPRCRDPDDQPFLDLAAAVRARWLLTRDAELLRVAPTMRRRFGVDVIVPADWSPALLDQISKR
ncbi:PIN domain-containing protein [Lysobacter humi (ex Lee et al. 2017)]